MRTRFLITVLLFSGPVTEASAHAFLVKAVPAVGSQLTGSVTELRLEFSEAIELAFSGVDLGSATGASIPISSFGFVDSSRRILTGKVPRLIPGVYRVRWHVVSADTHRTEGSFSFTVKP
jgi:methionine-rich copper-binding protein CopC